MDTREFERLAAGLRPRLKERAADWLQGRDEAEDLVQETLLTLWSVRRRLGAYRSPETLAVTILRNLCLNRIARRKRLTVGLPTTADRLKDEAPTAQQIVEAEETRKWLAETIDGLPARQTLIMRMSTHEGLTNAEIAAVLGVEEVTVRAQLSKARRSLLEKLKQKFNNKTAD